MRTLDYNNADAHRLPILNKKNMINQTTTSLEKAMSDTPRTDRVMPESTNWHYPDSDEYTAQRKEMLKLEYELAEARKQCDEWDRIAHEKLSELAVQIDRANRAEQQRDILAEVIEKYLMEDYSSRILIIALDAVKGGEA